MPESTSHKRAKRKAAGKPGQTEKPLSGGGRLDAVTKRCAKEIERSGNLEALRKAAQRLRDSGKPQKVLQVPQKDMGKAAQAMRDVGVSGTVKNMSGIRRRSIKKRKS